MGMAMGATNASIIYSPLGARSGAHMNPSVTLAFLRLGKVVRTDASFYIAAQFLGGFVGMLAAWGLLGALLADPAVMFVVTRPTAGVLAAAAGELTISFVMMSAVLRVSAHAEWAKYTGLIASVLVMLYITFEAPLSGMSMNPARTFGPALLAWHFEALWMYFLVPPLAMLVAAQIFDRYQTHTTYCAKLNHSPEVRCIFCGYEPPSDVHIRASREEETTTCITT
jgi:aquaporin Z